MEKHRYSGKTLEEAITQAKVELQEIEGNLFIKELETKSGLFKTKKIEIEVVSVQEVVEYLKEYLKKLTNRMGIHINVEVKKREQNYIFTLFSDNNALLIGKQGRTMDALTVITKQMIGREVGKDFHFVIDVGEYKLTQQKNIEQVAKRTAREVARTKIPAKLSPMNSYERRIVHTLLADYRGVCTESEGESPNRYVVIKPKEDE